MVYRILVSLCFLCFLSEIAISQVESKTCGFDKMHRETLETSKQYQQRNKHFEKTVLNQENNVTQRNNPIYTIPVVVHIMHLPADAVVGTGSNISLAQIQTGMAHLNDAFRNANDYSGGPYYTNAGVNSVDTEIEFFLANTDPDGLPSMGVNRVGTEHSDLYAYEFGASGFTKTYEMKTLSNWDSNDYLNIWLVNSICEYSTPSGCGIQGLSTFPPSHGYLNDGIVLEGNLWGTNSDNSKAAVHEIGHYLGLYHTFEGGCTETDCQTGGDRVCDTPPDNSTSSGGAGITMNSCNNDATVTNSSFNSDVEDIYENYMDYGSSSLKNTFTPGQKTRMNATLATTRASLFSGAALPVELISFEANLAHKYVQLRWVTTNETNNDYFILEKKVGDGAFEFLTKITAENMPSEVQQYVYLDGVSFNQAIYYKLTQVDKDGTQEVLGTTFIQSAGEITTTIFPNPISTGYLKYTSYKAANALLKIVNTHGQVVFQQTIELENGTHQIELDLSEQSNGLYVSILEIDGKNLLNKFVIKH